MASLKTFNTAEMQPCFCNFRKQIFEFLMCWEADQHAGVDG